MSVADRAHAESADDEAGASAASAPRRIWLCADDYGIARGVDSAIRDLIARGRLNATSVMVVAPSFDRAQAAALHELNVAEKRAAIGLHVTLTAPFRPHSKGFHPLRAGAFLPLGQMLRAAMLRRLNHDHLAAEIAMQLKAFVVAFGRPPDFVDGHQHVHLFPQIRDALLTVVKHAAPDAWVRQCGGTRPLRKRLADRKGLFLDALSVAFRRRAQEHGLRTNPGFAGTYGYRNDADFAALVPTFLDGLPDNGLVMCHPGFVDAELTRLDPLTSLREREYALLAGDGFAALLAAHGVELATAAGAA